MQIGFQLHILNGKTFHADQVMVVVPVGHFISLFSLTKFNFHNNLLLQQEIYFTINGGLVRRDSLFLQHDPELRGGERHFAVGKNADKFASYIRHAESAFFKTADNRLPGLHVFNIRPALC
ncbi:MAG TPA: hypothetical protein VI588_04230 [Candidatus Gracilibacteria bacterium]|nr:hypothetical protein [Candidatus Gracilibacteria bacterium]